ncbi:MAG TPA: peroxiredoxin [Balneolaceae bacterium]|nr:peroxiredoxin [Balneolaceae bacterium]|tara:strand:- start:35445 stop:35921 length:477 start_codon:yes stop_codon:yes gene_type:complete
MIETGTKMDPNFTLKVVQGGEEKEVNFADLLDKPTIVSVYMKNNTSSCDRQTLSLAEESEWFQKNGFNIVAISKDTCGSHKRYADKQGIDFILASDPEYKFATATDSVVEKKMYGKTFEAPSRSAFVIDSDGTILASIEKIDTKAHAEELKALVNELK